MATPQKKFDLEDRLVEFAVSVLNISENLPKSYASTHLSKQIIRSATAPALLYGEAQSAESRPDFIHKIKIGLKELRETFVCLKILHRKTYLTDEVFNNVATENDELISIFTASINTAKRNLEKYRS